MRVIKLSSKVVFLIILEDNEEEIKYWKVKVVGEQLAYTNKLSGDGTLFYSTVIIKNTRWPGTTCVWKVIVK
jgi:hypothetical protein